MEPTYALGLCSSTSRLSESLRKLGALNDEPRNIRSFQEFGLDPRHEMEETSWEEGGELEEDTYMVRSIAVQNT